MRKGQAAIVAGSVLWVVWANAHWAGLILALLGMGVVALIAAKTHPRTTCGTCKGQGRFSHWLFAWLFRLCANCGGNGRVISPLAARFGTPRIRETAATEARERAERTKNRIFGLPVRMPVHR